MDLETENRIAAILMKEAAEMRCQADKEGINAYLRPPNTRGRPNSRFLAATVLGIQQANRVVEVNEMWRIRQKEQELDDRIKATPGVSRRSRNQRVSDLQRSTSNRDDDGKSKGYSPSSSSKRAVEEDGLSDTEIEEFLHSRVKRGRGDVGSRMDETGPYLPDSKQKLVGSPDVGFGDEWENRVVLGPDRPLKLKSSASSEDESVGERQKRAKKVESSKQHHRKHRSEEKTKDKRRKKREEKKRRKHYK